MSVNKGADLRTISYTDLVAKSVPAISSLHSAAAEDGFFYLDLAGSSELSILRDASDLTLASKRVFELPMSEKMSFDTNKLGTLKNYGYAPKHSSDESELDTCSRYKPVGRNTGVFQGRQDGHELFLVDNAAMVSLHANNIDY